MFHVRRRPPDCHQRKRKKKPTRRTDDEIASGYRGSYDGQHEPMLVELLPGKKTIFYTLFTFDSHELLKFHGRLIMMQRKFTSGGCCLIKRVSTTALMGKVSFSKFKELINKLEMDAIVGTLSETLTKKGIFRS